MPCAAHPDLEAFHACTLCGLWHCEACLKPLLTPGRSRPILTCPRCGGLARVAMVRVAPPEDDVMELLRRPFTGEGMLTALALAAPFGLTVFPVRLLQLVFTCVWLGCLSGYYFQTIDHVGRGLAGLPFSAEPMSRWEVARALGRGVACVAVALGPAIAARIALPEERALAVLLAIYGLACAPAAILAAAITRSALNALWPPAWARLVAHAPAAYARLVGLYAASSLAIAVVAFTAAPLLLRVPLFGALAAAVLLSAMVIAQAALIGGFVRRHAEILGYG